MQTVHLLRRGEEGLAAQILPPVLKLSPLTKLQSGSRHQFNWSEFTPLRVGFESVSVCMRGRGVETLLAMQAPFHVWLYPEKMSECLCVIQCDTLEALAQKYQTLRKVFLATTTLI